MVDVSQNVLIDFQLNNQELNTTIDALQKTNDLSAESVNTYKQVNAELARNTALTQANTSASEESNSVTNTQQVIYDKLVNSLKNLSGKSKEAVQELLKFNPGQIAEGFAKTNTNVDEYLNLLTSAQKGQIGFGNTTTRLRTQILELTNVLAQLRNAGKENTEEFDLIATKTGKLKESLRIAQTAVQNLSSEGAGVKALGGVFQTFAAGTEVAVGATALFGDKNKDLEEVLIKVNSVMAISNGLQELFNFEKIQANVTTLRLVAAEQLETATQSKSIIVRYAAIAAQKALNVVMKANPIVLFLAALATFIAAIVEYTSITQKAAAETREFNDAMSQTGELLDAEIEGLQAALDKQNALLKDQGAKSSEVITNTGRNLLLQREKIVQAQQVNNKLLADLQNSSDKESIERYKTASDTQIKLEKQLQKTDADLYKAGLDLKRDLLTESLNDQINIIQGNLDSTSKSSTKQFALQRQLAVAQTALSLENARGDADKRFSIEQQLQKKIHDINISEQQFIEKDKLSIAEAGLITAQNESRKINDRISQEEIDRQKDVLNKQLNIELANDALTANEKKSLQAKTAQQILDLQRNFNKQSVIESLQDSESANQVILADVTKTEKQKLDVKINSIITQAAIEIEQNLGKVEKIKEIEAKRDEAINTSRREAIDTEAAYELSVFKSTTIAQDRGLEKQLADQAAIRNASGGIGADKQLAALLGTKKQSTEQQLNLIDTITNHQKEAIQIDIKALNDKNAKGLISDEDYTKAYLDLTDQQAQATEAGEKRKQDLIKETADLQKKRNQEILQDSLQAVSDGLNILSSLYQQQDQADQQRLDAKKQRIQDELDAGEITAKAAADRNKVLDAQQKQLQREQAKRDKEMALFQAIINTALAVTNALTTGDSYTATLRAIIAGALGAAQIAVIASKPIPQFNKGKKNNYEGFGEIGERNTEIVERNGRMYVVDKPTVTWLGAKDIVYNPAETSQILEDMSFGKNIIAAPANNSHQSFEMNYDRLGKAIGSNVPQYGIELTEEGIVEFVKHKNTTIKYLNRRRKWQR
jgi:hypothetical protein